MKLKSNVRHNGKFYKTGTEIKDNALVKAFTKLGLFVKEIKDEKKK